MTEVLKQPQYMPLPLHQQVEVIYAAVNGYLDSVPIERVAEWETAFYRFMDSSHPEVGAAIEDQKQISPDTDTALKDAIKEFNSTFQFEAAA